MFFISRFHILHYPAFFSLYPAFSCNYIIESILRTIFPSKNSLYDLRQPPAPKGHAQAKSITQ